MKPIKVRTIQGAELGTLSQSPEATQKVTEVLAEIVSKLPPKAPACQYKVHLIRYSKTDKYRELDNLLVAKFVALGDAVAYAKHRAETLQPEEAGWVVFEAYNKAGHRVYRGG